MASAESAHACSPPDAVRQFGEVIERTLARYTTRSEGDSEMRERGEDAHGHLCTTPLCKKGEGKGNSRWISELG